MRNTMRVFLLLLIVVVCAGACEQGDYEKATEPNEFSLLTYNVAGLPQGISQSDPIVNSPQIAVKLNRFDVVLVQEDFFYHYFLRYGAAHPYQSRPDYSRGSLGDGLNRFSFCAFSDHERIGWDACYGYIDHASDCLTPKGFSVARHEIAEGVYVDIYNLHMDAGSDAKDHDARSVGTDQLIETILSFSDGYAVIAAGDYNMRYSSPEGNANLERLTLSTQLIDAAIALGIDNDRIDMVFYRSSDTVALQPAAYKVETDIFADGNGQPLSDHDAISVLFEWVASQ